MTDVAARLLANENISVVRKKVRTASFDVKNRILTKPVFKDLPPIVDDLLDCHEIGHALFTDYVELTNIFDTYPNAKSYHGYFNVVEDVRIERLVKKKYPGSKKTFREGYKILHEMDFFELENSPIEERSFGDRLNLFYKGLSEQIEFTNQIERDFCERAYSVETLEEAFNLGVEIYNYDKENFDASNQDFGNDIFGDFDDENEDDADSQSMAPSDEKSENKNQSNSGQSSQSDESEEESDSENGQSSSSSNEDDKSKFEKSENGQDKAGSESDKKSDSNSDSKNSTDEYGKGEFSDKISSQEVFNKKLSSYADVDTTYVDIQFSIEKDYNPIIGYKTVLEETKYADVAKFYNRYKTTTYQGVENAESFAQYFNGFKSEAKDMVGYLKKEFDLKKSAEMLKRAAVDKTGNLDMRKLYAYKIKDDIFKRNTILKQGKNHGMVFLLDWSSSMRNVMQKTIEQVYILASFCKACNIPYTVLAFSSAYNKYGTFYQKDATEIIESQKINMKNLQHYSLIEFFNSSMSTHQFNTMAYRLLRTSVWETTWDPSIEKLSSKYVLHNTPFNSALAYMNYYLPKFKDSYKLEKLTLVTLTDGISHESIPNFLENAKWKASVAYVSPITKKRYELRDANGTIAKNSYVRSQIIETSLYVKMLRDAGNIVVGLNICENNYKSVQSSLVSTTANRTDDSQIKECRKEYAYTIPNTFYDLGIIFSKMLKEEEDVELSDKVSEKTSKGIAKEFMKQNKDKKKKRAFLDAFIKTIA